MSPTSEKENREAREFASAVLTGTVIGRSLQDALRSLSEEDAKNPTGENTEEVDRRRGHDTKDGGEEGDGDSSVKRNACHVRMNDQSVERILKSFEEAISESRICHEPDKDSAPHVLLKGRCDHYNKYGQNWMVSMDQVRIKARPTKFVKRRRDDRPSLWDRDDDREVTARKKEMVMKEKLQLLVYGDML